MIVRALNYLVRRWAPFRGGYVIGYAAGYRAGMNHQKAFDLPKREPGQAKADLEQHWASVDELLDGNDTAGRDVETELAKLENTLDPVFRRWVEGELDGPR